MPGTGHNTGNLLLGLWAWLNQPLLCQLTMDLYNPRKLLIYNPIWMITIRIHRYHLHHRRR
jgi:hypothetical protein